MFSVKKDVFILVFCICSMGVFSQSDKIILLNSFEYDDGRQKYYFELLDKSLEATGYQLDLKTFSNPTHRRIEYMLDQTEDLFIYFFLKTEERDSRWVLIDTGLTNKLIAHRILFIPRGQQFVYNNVNTLHDFRALDRIGAFGELWYDIEIWKHNQLKYYAHKNDWRQIYNMLINGRRGIDYFSRGVTEILNESALYPELDIEQNLMFIYDIDFYLYVNKSISSEYKRILTEALEYARNSGLIDQLIQKYWGEDLVTLNFDKRTKIFLETPDT